MTEINSQSEQSKIEQMLLEEIREQKRNARGIHNRALRLRKHETVRMPSDNLSKLEKRKIISPSILKITTIGEIAMEELIERINKGEIPLKSEFEELDFENRQKAVAELRRLHTNSEIIEVWKCASATLSYFFEKMQVAKAKGNNILVGQAAIDFLNKGRTTRGMSKIKEENNEVISDSNKIKNEEVVIIHNSKPTLKEKEVENALPLININRKYKAEMIPGLLDRLSLFLSGENQEFLIEIKVTEIS